MAHGRQGFVLWTMRAQSGSAGSSRGGRQAGDPAALWPCPASACVQCSAGCSAPPSEPIPSRDPSCRLWVGGCVHACGCAHTHVRVPVTRGGHRICAARLRPARRARVAPPSCVWCGTQQAAGRCRTASRTLYACSPLPPSIVCAALLLVSYAGSASSRASAAQRSSPSTSHHISAAAWGLPYTPNAAMVQVFSQHSVGVECMEGRIRRAAVAAVPPAPQASGPVAAA